MTLLLLSMMVLVLLLTTPLGLLALTNRAALPLWLATGVAVALLFSIVGVSHWTGLSMTPVLAVSLVALAPAIAAQAAQDRPYPMNLALVTVMLATGQACWPPLVDQVSRTHPMPAWAPALAQGLGPMFYAAALATVVTAVWPMGGVRPVPAGA